MNKIKKYKIFIFITTITKSMIELFIPIILFNKGLSFKEIIVFYLFKYVFLLIFSNLIKLLNISNKKLIITSSIISLITYVLLHYNTTSFFYLIIISFLYAFYLSTYWLYRHNTALYLIEDKMTTERSSSFMIITLIGIVPSSIIGGYLINNFDLIYLIIVILILTIISLLFTFNINIKRKKTKNIFFPVKNKIFLFLEQLKFITFAFFPLFAYTNISKSFTYVGLLNTLTSFISIIYIFFLSKKMDKNKKDYLSIMCVFLAINWILKLNISNVYLFLIITTFEGVFRYALETIVMRNIYSYGKEYDSMNYNVYIENIRNISRIIISVFLLTLNINLNIIIILGIISLFISSFIKFDDGIYGYKKNT